MKILITGGTGFIGSRLALRCLERGDSVRVMGQENNSAEAENRRLIESRGAEIVLGSVTEKDKLSEAVRGVDLVYHLAAAQHEANVPDQHFWDVNVTGTRNILEASVAAGVKRFVHGSTIGVYGSMLKGEIDESSPVKPDNIYGVTKLEAERLVFSFREKMPVVIIRISETYGPGDRRLLKLFKAIDKKAFFLIGSGENIHHLIYIDDLLQGLFLAATAEKAVGKVFVLSGRGSVTTNEMVETIAKELGTRIPKFRAPFWLFLLIATMMEKTLRPMGVQPPLHRRRMDFFKKSFLFSQKEAQRNLGFVPKYSFSDGVARTAKWYSEMGYLGGSRGNEGHKHYTFKRETGLKLAARMEPFDSFWEAPENIEKGYSKFYQFYKHNYLKYIPGDKESNILVVSCGPGYFVTLLSQQGYKNVLGIDSSPEKIKYARRKNLSCVTEEAFPFLEKRTNEFDVIFCEQELNHLTKEEILTFLKLCWNSLKKDGVLIVHTLNGANPITGAEALAQNFDHYNTFTEYSLRQILRYAGFSEIRVIPLNLYVFYKNPANYALILLDRLYSLFFRISFMMYGKANKIFTKKIAGIGRKRC